MHFKFLCENTLNTIFQQTSRPLHYCLMYTSGVKLNILFYIVHCWMCYISISIVWFSSSEFGVSVFGRGFHRIRFFGFNQELLFWCIPYWLWSSDASKWNNVNIKKCFPHRLQLFYPAAWAQLRLTQSISCRKPTSSYWTYFMVPLPTHSAGTVTPHSWLRLFSPSGPVCTWTDVIVFWDPLI